MMQFFNFFNARKLKDEINVFEGFSLIKGILKSTTFCIIIFMIIFLQAVLVTNGQLALKCYM